MFKDLSCHKAQELAVIDLGSNSFHMIIAREVNGALQILSRLKQQVQLAEGLDAHNHLSDEAIQRGLHCLSLFADRINGFAPQNVRIVATHTLRIALNAAFFLREAQKIIPYPIEIISGQEEARLIYFGAAHTLPEKELKLIVDIGGGSTEIALGELFDPILTKSRPIGCVSYTKRFFPNGKISKQIFAQAQLSAEHNLEDIGWLYRIKGWHYVFGASGTIKATHLILIEMGYEDGVITPKRLKEVVNLALKFDNSRALTIAGLSDERKPVFVAGLAILSALFNTFAIKELRFCKSALREGVLYEMNDRFRHQDIRTRTALSLVEHYNIDTEHSQRVLDTTRNLYLQWQKQNQDLATDNLEQILYWAATLHEIGLSINHSSIQKHSAYILQNSNLPGFNQEQQLLLATLVRFHKKTIKVNDFPHFNLYNPNQFIPLIQILRLAILLNNQRQNVPDLNGIQLKSKKLTMELTFPCNYLKNNLLVQIDLEEEQLYWDNIQDWKLIIKEKKMPTINR